MQTKVSFHGHSTYSDGIDNIKTLVKNAYDLQIDYFGVSDHDMTDSIKPFYDQVDQINLTAEFKIIPLMVSEIRMVENGVEIDTLFAKVGPFDQTFVDWLDTTISRRKNLELLETINQAIAKFDCLVVLPHPEMKFASSASFEKLIQVAHELDPKIIKNVGVEVNNWSSNVFPNNQKRELELAQLVKDVDLAKFGFADFHCASDIANQYSYAEVSQKTAQGLMEAIKTRQVAPGPMGALDKQNKFKLYLNLGRSFIRHHFLHPFLKP